LNKRYGLKRLEEESTNGPANSVNSEVSSKRPVLVLLSGAVLTTLGSVSSFLLPGANRVLEGPGSNCLSSVEGGEVELRKGRSHQGDFGGWKGEE
jgi:hypothetical protein